MSLMLNIYLNQGFQEDGVPHWGSRFSPIIAILKSSGDSRDLMPR
ncbi:MAG: hypothetical protein ACP5NY_06535 [Thermocladium sp.]